MLDILLTMITFVDRARIKNVYMHLIHCSTGAARDYERGSKRESLIADAVRLVFIFHVGPELSPARVIRES